MGTIHLLAPKKQKGFSKFMDYLSAPLSKPIVTLTKGWKAGAKAVKKSRKKIRAGKESGWGVIGTTLATTAVLGAGTIATGGGTAGLAVRKGALVVGKKLMPKTIKQAGTMLLVGGVLSSSAKARSMLASAPEKIYKSGRKLGEIIEDPSKARDILGITKDMTAKEKLIAGAKSAGKFGALVAGGLAVGTLAKKGIETYKERKLIKEQESAQRLAGLKQVGFTEARPVGIGGVPVAIPGTAPLTSSRATPDTLTPRPVQNIIQISVR